MRVLITQSMLFPWVGLLEQVRLADVVVHYDDVQFSKGSLVNRVQLKLPSGVKWMTVPLLKLHGGQSIDAVSIATDRDWRAEHAMLLDRSLAGAPYAGDARALLESVYETQSKTLGPLARSSFLAVLEYFGLVNGRRFIHIDELAIAGQNTNRVLDVVLRLGGTEYITGHGARNYLDHEGFEKAGVNVRYIDYQCLPYPQAHGPFTPFVSSLDLVANMGRAGLSEIRSETMEWRKFLERSA